MKYINCLILILFLAVGVNAQQNKKVNIVFIGNSITYGACLDNPKEEAPPIAAVQYLKDNNYSVKYANCGVSGHTTYNFLPAADTDFEKVTEAADSLYSEDALLLFSISLGTNDSAIKGPSGSPVSADQYKANMQSIIGSLLLKYPKSRIIIHCPIWYSPNTHNGSLYMQEGLTRLQTYTPQIKSLVNSSPSYIWEGDTTGFNIFKTSYKQYFVAEDGNSGVFYLHPNKEGAKKLGELWAAAILRNLKRSSK
ncbi:MAG: GDSL-type esterase/lipase family protein [Dysgonomonas sp.]